ncbi:amidase domain-containing protein [Paenibacillus assamensis]|uniref:amidase domain-containing protein n=1 Tax=Paenibacillus assamensis TaxID=311244 RepID=UPI00040482E7|nr:amidase domain-containing protein [Paenibacillus assamensis]
MKRLVKLSLLSLTIALTTTFVSFSSVSASNEKTVLPDKESIVKFYEANNEIFYDHIPLDIKTQYQNTISKIDKILEHQPGTITSISPNFSLNYYYNSIKLGVRLDLNNNDEFAQEVDALTSAIGKYIIKNDVPSLLEEPTPTTFGPNPQNDELVKILLNGSGYNTTNAVNYALKWTENGKELRNSSYDYYAGLNDCTNFVSQVLYAGGISMIRNDNFGYDYNDPDNWYYKNAFNDPPSHTWGGAHNQYVHFQNHSTNVTRANYFQDLKVGDVIHWDTAPNDGKFHIGHTTVVTKIDNKGNIFLTYHTSDKENEPITTLTNLGWPAYAWKVNH